MADLPKVNLSPALAVVFSLGCKSYQAFTQLVAKHKVGDLLTQAKEHTVLKKAAEQKEMLMSLLGLALILHGAQFKNLLLCFQVVVAFLYERIERTVAAVLRDVAAVREKVLADAPAAQEQEPTAEASSDDKSKHAAKRDKKKASYSSDNADQKVDEAEMAKKVLKFLDSEKLSAAGTEILAAVLVCILVINGGLAQKVTVAYALVNLIAARLELILEFPGNEDIQAWTRLMSRAVLWMVVLPISLFMGPLALVLNSAALGARLVGEHGFEKLVQVNPTTMKGLTMALALMGLGTMWQLWSWASNSGMAWYFTLVYFPAIVAEACLSVLG